MPDEAYSQTYIEVLLEQARRAHSRKKQEAADIGTQAHNLLEHHFRSGLGLDRGEAGAESLLLAREFGPVEVVSCFEAGLAWHATHSVEIVSIEQLLYSRKHRCAGRLDKLATVDLVLSLIDYKSSKGIYPEYWLQTAAYIEFYEEMFPGTKIEKTYLVRLGKLDGAFEVHERNRAEYQRDRKAFNSALVLYRRLKELEGVSGRSL